MSQSLAMAKKQAEPTFPPGAWGRFWAIAFKQWDRIQAEEAAAKGEPAPPVTTTTLLPENSLPPGIRP